MTDLMNNIPNSTSANKNSPFSKIWGLTNKIAHLEFSLLPRLMEMEYRGVYLDTPRVQQHFTSLVALETTLKQKFFDTLPPKQKRINPNSPKQLIQYLHKTIGDQGFTRPDGKFRALKHMTKWRKNPKTYEEELVYSTDQDELKEFVGKGIPEVDALYKYKSATANIKRIQEFFSLVQKDSRLYTSFKQWGAISGRLSCPKPNLQNIKNKEKEGINLRSLFCSPPGRKLVVVDYSQIQLVIIAEISQDPMMLAIINSPQKINNPKYPELDLHIATAATVNGIEYDEVTADQRKAAKAANFGLCFGMGAAKFKEFALISYDLYYTEDKCKEIRDAYFSLYRGVQQWHYKVGKTERNGFYTCQTLYGRRVYADGFTKATNFPVQGTEKDIMAFAICFIHDRFKKEGLDAALVNCVHDELVAECSEDIADKVLHIMEEEMVRAGKLILKTVRVKAEGKVVDLWSQKG
jgi:DNA polymerase-1